MSIADRRERISPIGYNDVHTIVLQELKTVIRNRVRDHVAARLGGALGFINETGYTHGTGAVPPGVDDGTPYMGPGNTPEPGVLTNGGSQQRNPMIQGAQKNQPTEKTIQKGAKKLPQRYGPQYMSARAAAAGRAARAAIRRSRKPLAASGYGVSSSGAVDPAGATHVGSGQSMVNPGLNGGRVSGPRIGSMGSGQSILGK